MSVSLFVFRQKGKGANRTVLWSGHVGECREAVIDFHFDSFVFRHGTNVRVFEEEYIRDGRGDPSVWHGVSSGAAFYVLTRMYLRRTADGTRIFSNLSVRKPDQGLRRTEPVRCLPAPTACARRTDPEKPPKDRSRSAVRLLLQRVFELRYASHKQCHCGEIRDTHCRI